MRALQFWKTVTADHADLLEGFLSVLEENRIAFCVVGGQGVNAYAEPVVSLDLAVAVAVGDLSRVESLMKEHFRIERFPHSLNISLAGSKLRIQIQTDPRYGEFVAQASPREVLEIVLPVASLEDVLQGKLWAFRDAARRGSKRQKDLADISRLVEAYPRLCSRVPEDVLARPL